MESKKLELYGLLAVDPNLDLKSVVQRLKVPINKLRTWKKDYEASLVQGNIEKTINADKVIIERVAEEVTKEITTLEIDTETNEVVSKEELEERNKQRELRKQEKEKRVALFKDSVDGLNALKSETQATAADLIYLIAEQVDDMRNGGGEGEVRHRDILSLTSALTSIQNAFFNRPVTNVSVNTQNNVGGETLGDFRAKLKS